MLLACAVLSAVSIKYVDVISIFCFGVLNYKTFLFPKTMHLILYKWQLFQTEKNTYVRHNVAELLKNKL